jgi:hypothetical protein
MSPFFPAQVSSMPAEFLRTSRWFLRGLGWGAFAIVVYLAFRNVRPDPDALATGDCLDRASHQDKYQTRLEAVEGYARCIARLQKTPVTGNPRCAYAGVWSSQRNDVEYFITLNADGSFVAEPGRNTRPGEQSITGAWTVANQRMVWAYDSGPVWPPDINPIFDEKEQTFKLREVDGATTRFLRISREGVTAC